VSFQNLILKNYEARKDEFYIKASWYGTKAKWLYHGAPEGQIGQMEMKCILYSTWTKVTQVSDVAHGPLVFNRHWSYSMQTNNRLIDFRQSSLKIIFKRSKSLRTYTLFVEKKIISTRFQKLLIFRTKIPKGILQGHLKGQGQ
jgi:hypothetical protein